MLASHKLVRWLVFLTLPLILVGLALMAISRPWVSLVLAGALLVLGLGVIALRWPTGKRLPGPLAFLGFAVASSAAGLAAWLKALRGERNPIWEPTRRPALTHRPDSGAVENPGG
jgi:hypothetical protein